MRQRLGIAIAFVGNPRFLVLDEPINGLDPQGIIEMRQILLNLNRQYGIILDAAPSTLTIFSHRMTIVRVLGSKFLLYHFVIKAVIISKYHRDTN